MMNFRVDISHGLWLVLGKNVSSRPIMFLFRDDDLSPVTVDLTIRY